MRGSWYVEPWSIDLIGGQYPGPSKNGCNLSLTFTTEDNRRLVWRSWVNVAR